MCVSVCDLYLRLHLHECVNVCRAAVVFVLCNPVQPVCNGSISQTDGCQSNIT